MAAASQYSRSIAGRRADSYVTAVQANEGCTAALSSLEVQPGPTCSDLYPRHNRSPLANVTKWVQRMDGVVDGN